MTHQDPCPVCSGTGQLSDEDLEHLRNLLYLVNSMQEMFDDLEEAGFFKALGIENSKNLRLTGKDKDFLSSLKISSED